MLIFSSQKGRSCELISTFLQRFGNINPTFSQIELVQQIVTFISENEDKAAYQNLAQACFNDTISRETIQKDSKYIYFQAKLFNEYSSLQHERDAIVKT